MLAGLVLLRNMLNINMVCAKHFGQSITCVALPSARGKNPHHVVVPMARELVACLWAMAKQVPVPS
jgi:hypothetical protein